MLKRARAGGHDVALIQVVAPEEVEPTHDSICYSRCRRQTVEAYVRRRVTDAVYALRFAGCAKSFAFSRKHGATYVRVRTDDLLEEGVRRFVARGVD
ncbi:MAG: hypothetical protein U0165_16175 [Polyangiaceae bacterium]